MNSAPAPNEKPIWKNPSVYSGTVLFIVAVYVAWIVFSRWNENRQIERRAREAAAQKQREQDQRAVDQMGGSELAIQSFYGNPTIRRGQSAQLCYGVANAQKVTLDPPSGPVWPSYSRCLDVSPNKTTTYTLTVTDDTGHSASQAFTIKVQ